MNRRTICIAAGLSALMLGAMALDTMDGGTFKAMSELRTSQSAMTPVLVAQAATGKPAAVQQSVVNVTDANFANEVLAADTPVIIDLYADWCGPCRAFAPVFDAAAPQYTGKLKFARVDVDAQAKLATFFQVRAIPMIVIVKKDASGKLVIISKTGALNEARLKQFIDGALDPSNAGALMPAWK